MFSVLILTITNASVIYSTYKEIIYLMQGLYGSVFGIIAGPIGIRISYVNQTRHRNCLWTAFITLVCWSYTSSYTLHLSFKCIFTTLGSLIGFGFSCWMMTYNTKWFILNNDGTYSSHSHYGYYGEYTSYYQPPRYDDDDEMSDEISIPGLLAVEAFLLIGEWLWQTHRHKIVIDILKCCVLFQLLPCGLAVKKRVAHHQVALAYHLNRWNYLERNLILIVF